MAQVVVMFVSYLVIDEFGTRKFQWGSWQKYYKSNQMYKWLLGVALSLLLVVVCAKLCFVFNKFTNGLENFKQKDSKFMVIDGLSKNMNQVAILFTTSMVALLEELFFRSFVKGLLRNSWQSLLGDASYAGLMTFWMLNNTLLNGQYSAHIQGLAVARSVTECIVNVVYEKKGWVISFIKLF